MAEKWPWLVVIAVLMVGAGVLLRQSPAGDWLMANLWEQPEPPAYSGNASGLELLK